jgi:hypothetical protein
MGYDRTKELTEFSILNSAIQTAPPIEGFPRITPENADKSIEPA